ncbi:hypothetical protein WDC_1758 [Paucilactobacillus wasatchensis]|uniref:Uncharacterized protein n=1 Tax=Paucilactobacillus wasatchensis TaxID=1335616 RepID=A0A0D1A4P2_9LACO|nr:hypothetical protein WDC_1758 [Paucilactobacillus wasatchensis]
MSGQAVHLSNLFSAFISKIILQFDYKLFLTLLLSKKNPKTALAVFGFYEEPDGQ